MNPGAAPDPLRLLDWTIPKTRHQLTRADAAFYALSVGMGSDASDPRVRPFVDPWSERQLGHPAMALVLGYPGFWLGAPEVLEQTGVSVGQILHVQQSVDLAAPLPGEGIFTGETRVTGLVGRGEGRGALLTSERRITLEGASKPIAVCTQTHLLRGIVVDSPRDVRTARAKEHRLADRTVVVPSRPDQALLYRLNGDANPLHFDANIARAAGFERPILHGMCTIGLAVTGLLGALAGHDPARILGFSVRMSAPVYPGDTIGVDVWEDGSFQARAVERDVTVLDGGQLKMHQAP